MKIAYVAGPYRSKWLVKRVFNILCARRIAIKYWKKGYIVICPHMNSAFFDRYCDDEIFLQAYLELIQFVDLVVISKRWKNSVGTKREIVRAKEFDKKITFE
jgi:hypothetical protein